MSRLLEDKLGVKVLLSRDGDHFVPLRDRTSYANRERADLFVSIHANAHRVVASEGVETYFLSSEATDNASRQVAALENSVVQLEKPSAGGPASRTDVLKTILWELAQSEFQRESSRLAETVLDSMTQALKIPNRGVKQAGFYVLGGAAMPAILIEIGFVSNPQGRAAAEGTRLSRRDRPRDPGRTRGVQARLELKACTVRPPIGLAERSDAAPRRPRSRPASRRSRSPATTCCTRRARCWSSSAPPR